MMWVESAGIPHTQRLCSLIFLNCVLYKISKRHPANAGQQRASAALLNIKSKVAAAQKKEKLKNMTNQVQGFSPYI